MRWLFGIVACLVWAGCGRQGAVERDTAKVTAPELSVADVTVQAAAWADSVLEVLTLKEKVGQLFMPASYTRADGATMQVLRGYVEREKVGGLVFLKGDTLSMRLIADSLQRMACVPLFMAVDAEWGLGMRMEGGSVYPKNWQLGSTSEHWMYEYGNAVGEECAAVGLNMVLGPVLDVAPGPGTVMYRRSLGADPGYVARMGAAYARGVEDAGVMPVAKHFPGHGFTRTDSHELLPLIHRSAEAIDSIDLLPFRQYINYGFPAIMAGHIAMPSISGDSLPAVLSAKIMQGLLRDKMGFHGLLITDALNMKALMQSARASSAVGSIKAGADIIIAPLDTRKAIEEVLAAVASGELGADVVADRCRRVLFYKYLLLLR